MYLTVTAMGRRLKLSVGEIWYLLKIKVFPPPSHCFEGARKYYATEDIPQLRSRLAEYRASRADLVSLEGVAKKVGVMTRTVLKHVRAGLISAPLRIGSRSYYKRSQVREIVKHFRSLDKLYTLGRVARLLGVTNHKLWMRRDKLPDPEVIAGRKYWSEKDIPSFREVLGMDVA